MNVTVFHYDAFSSIPGKGNPAGVLFEAQRFADEQMQNIAQSVGFNETAFVLPPEQGDVRLRYFTPGHEVDLCGHATVVSIFALYQQDKLADRSLPLRMMLETKAGMLPVEIDTLDQKIPVVMSKSPEPPRLSKK